jgi:hypothetical protein
MVFPRSSAVLHSPAVGLVDEPVHCSLQAHRGVCAVSTFTHVDSPVRFARLPRLRLLNEVDKP